MKNLKGMDKKQLYSVSLKFLTLLGVVGVMGVMINSLFPPPTQEQIEKHAITQGSEPAVVKASIESLFSGRMMLVSWAGRSIGVVKRVETIDDFVKGEPLNSQWRSVSADYFVFLNSTGRAQCPLYLFPEGDRLKDTCTGYLFDMAGQRLEGNGPALNIPPHYFESTHTIVIGAWNEQDAKDSELNN